MLLPRILSAIVCIPLVILVVFYGGLPLIALCALVMFLALFETKRMFDRLGLDVPFGLMSVGITMLLVSVYFYKDAALTGSILATVFIFLIWIVFLYPKCSLVEMAMGLLATFYVGLFIYFYLLRTLPGGWIWIIFMLIGTWASDTSAYFVGKVLGRHPLAPVLSPGKTLEGAIGGISGSILVAAGLILIYPSMPGLSLLLLGLFLGVAAQIGDLVESAFKRQVGVKDAGNIIPGHGGILDRLDSMLFTAPLVYYYVQKIILR